MLNLIKALCKKMCKNYFEDSETNCISTITFQDKLSLIFKPSTQKEVQVSRKIKQICKITQNRFWILYYHITKSKIDFSCSRCKKSDSCEDYILNRIVKYIKKFDIKKESNVFKKVRDNLTHTNKISNLDKKSKEVSDHYTKKIKREYREKVFNFDMGMALIENATLDIDSSSLSIIESRIQRYRLYQSSIVLRNFAIEAFENEKPLKEPLLIELLHKEKFTNYIRTIIESRFLDFIKSKQYSCENSIDNELTQPMEIQDDISSKDIETILSPLSNEQKIIYKLKNAIPLDNREFLNITYKMDYLGKDIIDSFSSEEKLYIKFSIQFEIDDDSSHFSMIDVPSVKTNISKKISDYREKLKSQSYINDKDEIFIKLIYSEPLSAKEIGVVFNLTSKQINKKVENIKKRLQRLEKKS